MCLKNEKLLRGAKSQMSKPVGYLSFWNKGIIETSGSWVMCFKCLPRSKRKEHGTQHRSHRSFI